MIICLSIVLPQLAAYSSILSPSSKYCIAFSKSSFLISSYPSWLSLPILRRNFTELPQNYRRLRLILTIQRYSAALLKVTPIYSTLLALSPTTLPFSIFIPFWSVMRCLLPAFRFLKMINSIVNYKFIKQ